MSDEIVDYKLLLTNRINQLHRLSQIPNCPNTLIAKSILMVESAADMAIQEQMSVWRHASALEAFRWGNNTCQMCGKSIEEYQSGLCHAHEEEVKDDIGEDSLEMDS